ncbi:hypothetical protein J1N35_014409 [Gossypium stocksii]|uniref:Reverse transcriptase domain-containing protein n=1 Tax=Gossypium stocksii TaxID=47602 RepID=A0A9D4A7K3_9ROSI|nr:hypothetical protein J1N35_014409 [Gossypium stocksii]
MAIKIDLERAYDRVYWEFIDTSFRATGIPYFLCNVIMSAISSSTMQVLWNGVPTSKFSPARGVRQGYPLSPYLFILCMEWLSHNIHSAIEIGNWAPIRLVHNGPPLSHLFFADDLILFGHAEEHQAREVNDLEFYLGVPLFHERVTSNTLHFVVDKTMMVPKGLCDEIERIVQRFVWGSTSDQAKVALIGWDSVCQLKSHGGLSLRFESFGLNTGFPVVYQKIYLEDIVLLYGDPLLWNRYLRMRKGQEEVLGIVVLAGFVDMSARMCYIYLETALLLEPFGIKLFQKEDIPDGSVKLEERFAAAGGFIRDHNERWIMGYCRYLGTCSMLEAELWGVLDGLNLVLNRSFEKVLIQADNIEAVNAIQEGASGTSYSTLIRRILLILNRIQ